MAPNQKRNVDDSRSETSSSLTNQKDLKAGLSSTATSTGAKVKRPTTSAPNPPSQKSALLSVPTTTAAPEPESQNTNKDPSLNLARNEWASAPNSFLRTYRIAHRLPVACTFSHPHADIIYRSSELALRAPSAVLARRKLREQKRQKRALEKSQINGVTGAKINKLKSGRRKDKDSSKDSALDNISSSTANSAIAQSIEPSDPLQGGDKTDPNDPTSPSSTSSTYLGPRETAPQLAAAVRKHFNAQQISEADTIARFTYVVQQAGRPVWIEGAGGDGMGHWMGSNGREIKKGDGPGGDVGFRLRFRP